MTGSALASLGLTLVVTAAVSAAFLLVVFFIALRVGRYNVVDVAWGPGFALIAVVALALSGGHGDTWRKALLAAATVIWGLRLGGYIAWRGRGQGEDPRYAEMLDKAPGQRPGSRPGYAEYVARTSGFFPWPPRRGPTAQAG